jgi:hypothetical protein
VWRIRLDTACQRLAVEVRDPDLLLAYFYNLDIESKALQKLDVNPSKAWWQGLEDAQFGLIFLHGYGDRKTGQHKGITAIEASTGNIKWTLNEMAFYGLTDEGVLVYQADKPEDAQQVVLANTGTVVHKNVSHQHASQQTENYNELRYRACIYPVSYKEGEAYFGEVYNFLNMQAGVNPVAAIEYAEANNSIVISYYEESSPGILDNFVSVYDLEGNLCLNVKLGSGLSGIGSDTFFIFNLNLYLIQDKHIIQVYRLLA